MATVDTETQTQKPLGKLIKPRNDVFTAMLIMSFIFFGGAFAIVWVWLAQDYDSGFPAIHGKTKDDEVKRRTMAVKRLYNERETKKAFLPQAQWDNPPDFDESTGLPRKDENLKDFQTLATLKDKYPAAVKDEALRKAAEAAGVPPTPGVQETETAPPAKEEPK
jgi:hypothetical protein